MSQAAVDDLIELLEHSFPMPDVASPAGLPDRRHRLAAYLEQRTDLADAEGLADLLDRPQAIDTRIADWSPADRTGSLPPYQNVWLRADGTPTATSGRGMARGLVFTQEGTLVASVVQEGLIRMVTS